MGGGRTAPGGFRGPESHIDPKWLTSVVFCKSIEAFGDICECRALRDAERLGTILEHHQHTARDNAFLRGITRSDLASLAYRNLNKEFNEAAESENTHSWHLRGCRRAGEFPAGEEVIDPPHHAVKLEGLHRSLLCRITAPRRGPNRNDRRKGANMAEENRSPRFAVLIDADNTSPRIAAGLFEEVAKFGEASVRRIYGDFSGQRLKSWAEILPKFAIDPYQQFAYTTGKNASDIALVIDAMDLLHSGRLHGFCLVSSDSDFTRLASRLREQGADVYGFGEQKTPESFRQACRRFIYTENLLPEAQVAALEEGPSPKSLQPASAAIPILSKAIEQMETEDGWVGLGVVGQRLANIASDFDPRTYGYRKLSDLVRNTGAFDLDQPEGRAMRIRAKPALMPKVRRNKDS
jgi:hypothetical protein